MKIIQNKIIIKSKDVSEEEKDITVSELLKIIINTPKPGGLDFSEVRKAVKVLDKLSDADEIIELEDEEYRYAKERMDSHKWNVPTQEILEFHRIFKEAKEPEKKEK